MPTMSSYLTSLTANYSSLRRLLPTSLSEDADQHINSDADSHVSRVLRAYYAEKGRPFPAWLGPDPNTASKAPVPLLANPPASGAGSLRAGRAAAVPSTGLGDLFADSPPQAAGGNTRDASDPLSLRHRRPAIRSPGFKGGSSDSIPYPQKVALPPPSLQQSYSSTPTSSSASGRSTPVSQQPTARPLPSQREGSYQSRLGLSSSSSHQATSSTSSLGKEPSSVQQRLKARLGGGGSRGPSPISGGASTPPPAREYDPYSSTNYNYNPAASSGGSSFNPYEDTSTGTSGSSGSRNNPYASASDNTRNPYASAPLSRSGPSNPNQNAPYTAATSPWVSGDDGYGYGYSGGGSDSTTTAQSSLAPPRRGPGLPSSPRRRG